MKKTFKEIYNFKPKKNPKTAICLYGIVGGTDGKDGMGANIPFEKCYETNKKYIIDVNNSDVFMHSWSVDVEDELVKLYTPKKYQFQKQIMFDHPQDRNIPETNLYKYQQGHRALSKWYSLKRAIELKSEYEKEQGFKYDYVMLTRFDTLFFRDLVFTQCDPSFLWVPNFNNMEGDHKNPDKKADRLNMSLVLEGLSDMWYFSSSKIIDEFIDIYGGVKSTKYRISQHKAAWDCLRSKGYTRDILQYLYHRYFDFDLYRWYVLRNFFKKGDGNVE